MNKYYLYLVAFLSILSTAMSADANAAKNINVLHVEVLVFSGRPNPVFTITDPAQINEILGEIGGLPAETEVSSLKQAAPGLGYRGVVVENLSAAQSDVQVFSLHRGHAQLLKKQKGNGRAAAGSVDASKQTDQKGLKSFGAAALEDKLLNLARSRGIIDDGLFDHINRGK